MLYSIFLLHFRFLKQQPKTLTYCFRKALTIYNSNIDTLSDSFIPREWNDVGEESVLNFQLSFSKIEHWNEIESSFLKEWGIQWRLRDKIPGTVAIIQSRFYHSGFLTDIFKGIHSISLFLSFVYPLRNVFSFVFFLLDSSLISHKIQSLSSK